MDIKAGIELYREIVGYDSAKARKVIQKLDYHDNYYLLKCIAQTYLDESRFKDDGGSNLREYFDWRKWRMAEKYIIQAFTINSENGDVVYTMGSIRKLNNQIDTAIYCFEKVIKIGVKRIAYGEYGRGLFYAKELVNDARFELYRLHYKTNPKLANKYLQTFKNELRKGTSTIFRPLKEFLLK